jgi:hypothetical protein
MMQGAKLIVNGVQVVIVTHALQPIAHVGEGMLNAQNTTFHPDNND